MNTSKPTEEISSDIKLIAFYLPQFHPIAENDAWWGKGFTEWRNVTRGTPQFTGHYQPHLPADLGFYDLRVPEIQQQQVELASAYGIHGFCFYFYWFNGKTLLEKPLQQFVKNDYNFPFCLCWANENWTRRWDGKDQEVLMAQNHSPHDDIEFISYVSSYLTHKNYICVDGKPLLLVYRPGLFPNAQETAERWRQWFRDHGFGEIYLACTQSFEINDPAEYGFDAAIEFPPNLGNSTVVNSPVELINPHYQGTILDWRNFVDNSRAYSIPPYKLFRGVCPSWDNEARRTGRGTVFLNSSPEGYREWLRNACIDTHKRLTNPAERFVFINAWNEWAEGAHLEPDQRYGHAWLEATRNALRDSCSGSQSAEAPAQSQVIVVSHDAHPHGAQYIALNIIKTLASSFNYTVDTVLLGGGILTDQFAEYSTVYNLAGMDSQGDVAKELAILLAKKGHTTAIVNSAVSGLFLGILEQHGISCVALVHELSGIIQHYNLTQHAHVIAASSRCVVFPARQVADSFTAMTQLSDNKCIVRPQGIYKRNQYRQDTERAKKELRALLGISPSSNIILGVGFADYRKGVDLFVEIALLTIASHPETFFVWVGHWDDQIMQQITARLADEPLAKNIIFTGRHSNTDVYYAGADIFALTSREDPFPSVVMESLEVAVPVIGFRGAGGFNDLLDQGCGMLVEIGNVHEFSAAVRALLDAKPYRTALGQRGATLIRDNFSYRQYVFDLLQLSGVPLKRISVIVPNYNYAHYLRDRLSSITNQTYPIYEIIVLDDASSDNSVNVIMDCLDSTSIDCKLTINRVNSGSVFSQWQRGINLAKGEFIWICEADDIADSRFLEKTIKEFDDDQVVLCFTQSYQINSSNEILNRNYRNYTDEIDAFKWESKYVIEGLDELKESIAIKNTIPNVSGVLFKTAALKEALTKCRPDLDKLKIAGDWSVYTQIMLLGKVAFLPESLNVHRRHQDSTTLSSEKERHIAEIIYMQRVVSNSVEIDEEIKNKAQRYVQTVYKLFSLDPAYTEAPEANPEVRVWLEYFLN